MVICLIGTAVDLAAHPVPAVHEDLVALPRAKVCLVGSRADECERNEVDVPLTAKSLADGGAVSDETLSPA
jgi:hypothetical protein